MFTWTIEYQRNDGTTGTCTVTERTGSEALVRKAFSQQYNKCSIVSIRVTTK
jgi:hypothetical protein